MNYELPNPSSNPIRALVISYKTLKEVEYDDIPWDKIHFKRFSKSAKSLLDICGDFFEAEKCLLELSKRFEEAEFFWTLETIVKHAHDWKLQRQKGKTHGRSSRERLFNAIHQQGTVKPVDPGRSKVTGAEILDLLGKHPDSEHGTHRDKDGTGSGSHEKDLA